MNAKVTISLDEFDEVRKKAAIYDEEHKKYLSLAMDFENQRMQFQKILENRMKNVLEQMVRMRAVEMAETITPKLINCAVNVDIDKIGVYGMKITIGTMDAFGAYDAVIDCVYDKIV